MTPTLQTKMATIRRANPQLAAKIEGQCFCITSEDLPEIEKIDRMMQCLVKTNMGRFTTPAQNVKWYLDIIEAHYQFLEQTKGEGQALLNGGDYVRSVELAA